MNDKKYLEQSNRLRSLLRIPNRKRNQSAILEMASLYRNLSAVLLEIKSQSIRSEVESSVIDAHRYLNTVPLSGKKVFHYLFQVLPVAAFRSSYVRFCTVLFYSVFFASLAGGYLSKDYAVAVLGEATLEQYTDMHKSDDRNFNVDMAFTGSGYYIVNNVTLDLITYGTGILV
ncbi:MAG: hypothetical protein H3C43_05835, partial [Leptonema sp. (in: Bacteria)]|nr:hypothetical protein [Leptonema sp. (in: bacteria)]